MTLRPPPRRPPRVCTYTTRVAFGTTWIIDADGSVTGVQRQPDGSTSPAPSLSTDGIAVIDGRTVTATRVQGDSVL